MKIINANKPVVVDELYEILQNKLNALFQERRKVELSFDIIKDGERILIHQPEFFAEPVITLTANGSQLQVDYSEHYIDDINAITLNSILDELFVEHLGATAPQI